MLVVNPKHSHQFDPDTWIPFNFCDCLFSWVVWYEHSSISKRQYQSTHAEWPKAFSRPKVFIVVTLSLKVHHFLTVKSALIIQFSLKDVSQRISKFILGICKKSEGSLKIFRNITWWPIGWFPIDWNQNFPIQVFTIQLVPGPKQTSLHIEFVCFLRINSFCLSLDSPSACCLAFLSPPTLPISGKRPTT